MQNPIENPFKIVDLTATISFVLEGLDHTPLPDGIVEECWKNGSSVQAMAGTIYDKLVESGSLSAPMVNAGAIDWEETLRDEDEPHLKLALAELATMMDNPDQCGRPTPQITRKDFVERVQAVLAREQAAKQQAVQMSAHPTAEPEDMEATKQDTEGLARAAQEARRMEMQRLWEPQGTRAGQPPIQQKSGKQR